MKIIYSGDTPSFNEGLPDGISSVGFNADNKPIFELRDGVAMPDGAREAVDADLIGLPDAAKSFGKMLTQNAIAVKFGNGDHARAGMSLVGVAADAAQMLVLFASADAVALAGADDFASYKAARMSALAGLSGGEEGAARMVAQAAKLLTDVASGEVTMPFMVKPEQATGVFRDVAEKATLVAGVLAQAVS